MPKKVGIILVNYKDYARRFLNECSVSLREQEYPKELYQVYIVDNASSNESRQFIKEQYSEVKIIPRTDGNYTAANNAGIKQAEKDGCQYFVIANMDTKFDPNWLAELVKASESDNKIGIVQSKILLYPKTLAGWKNLKINSLGNIMHYLGFGFTSNYNMPDREIKGLPEINGYASGSSFIIKKEVIDKIGYYDEEYYMYHDDIDLNWRAKLAGYKIVLAPKSIIYHKYEFSRSILMIYYMERNRYLALFHYYHILTILLILPALLMMELGMIVYSVINGWLTTKLKVINYLLKISTWVKIARKRKQIRAIRQKADGEIIKSFSGQILFQEISNPILKYFANPLFNLYWQVVKRLIVW